MNKDLGNKLDQMEGKFQREERKNTELKEKVFLNFIFSFFVLNIINLKAYGSLAESKIDFVLY